MRARTKIFSNVQQPLTVFGLPPSYFALILGGGMISLFLPLFLGYPFSGVLLGTIVSVSSSYFLLKITREDVHSDMVIRSEFMFYGFSKIKLNRVLQAGGVDK